MCFTKICLRIVSSASISLIIFSCSEEKIDNATKVPATEKKVFPDLTEAIQKRVENKPEDAIKLLRKYNEEFPDSPKILIQLGRSLIENKQYSLAAFRFDQAVSSDGPKDLLLESAEAYKLAGDLDSAIKRYSQYLDTFPSDKKTRIKLARVLAQDGKSTDALNEFEQSIDFTSADDSLLIGNLYLDKKIYVKAEYWLKKSAQMESSSTAPPLLGLLRIKFETGDESAVETLLLAIEKSFPGTLNNIPQTNSYSKLLIKRRLAEFNQRGVVVQNLSTSELIQELFRKKRKAEEPVISSGPKLAPVLSATSENIPKENSIVDSPEPVFSPDTSLADAFATFNEAKEITPTALELGWNSYLKGNYSSALLYARNSLKDDGTNSEAWRLSSQSHFQLGEIREAEMTILEAIRHDPADLQIRIDYLNIARDTLSSSRYLRELEKTHERFPASGEILWQLARRYHLVERMPVTAGILYRKLLTVVPKGSGLYQQAEMELIKIQNL
jgi:tetratricopeptide (TPR) repeat protein